MSYGIGGLGLVVMVACAIMLVRSFYEAPTRRPHLVMLSLGFFQTE